MNLWFTNAVNNSWSDADNWFEDAGLTTPHSAIPNGTDVCVVTANCTLTVAVTDDITVNAGVTLTIDPITDITLSGTLVINGTLTGFGASAFSLTSSGSLTFGDASSLIAVDSGSKLKISGTAVSGTLTCEMDIVVLAGGTLTVSASKTLTYVITGGTGFSVSGTLTIEGTWESALGIITVESTGLIDVLAGGTFDNYDCNLNGGAIHNAGTVKVHAFIMGDLGSEFTQNDTTGKTELIGAGTLDIFDQATSFDVVNTPPVAPIQFW